MKIAIAILTINEEFSYTSLFMSALYPTSVGDVVDRKISYEVLWFVAPSEPNF